MKDQAQRFGIVVGVMMGIVGCSGRYTAQLGERTVLVPQHMIARPIDATLFVVADPAQVDSDFPIRDSNVRVRGFRPYLAGAIRDTLRPYFRDVQIVRAVPRSVWEPYVVADVRLDVVEARNHTAGNLEYRVLRMQWAIAFRPAGSDDYVFTFVGEGRSEYSYQTLEMGCEQMVQSALGGFVNEWSDSDVVTRLQDVRPLPSEDPPHAFSTGAVREL